LAGRSNKRELTPVNVVDRLMSAAGSISRLTAAADVMHALLVRRADELEQPERLP
jgi:hypothetical protein